ncbi:LuxR C-terminal-related transcriptional regulator [Micromonospora sp. KLBMP9576]|uniref:helix-turn-helix transcriptional regulator n=1 Tax=Micromonospora sp. KLBMP9576 TaxID=3424769 RepID=UPI003D8EE3C3
MWDLLGLDHRDESIYRHHVVHPDSTLSQTATATGLPPDFITASLDRLLSCGLLRREASGQIAATPTGPTIVGERLRGELDAQHARRRSQLALFQSEMTRMVNDHLLSTAYAPVPQVDRLPSADAADLRITELVCNARAEVHQVDTETDPIRAGGGSAAHAALKAHQRGVEVRAIYPPADLARPELRRTAASQLRAGIQVRTTVTTGTQFFLVDRSVAILSGRRAGTPTQAVLVREGLLVEMLSLLFDLWWRESGDATSSYTGDQHGPAGEGEISEDERMVLQLLGEGLKDETLAKKLGISVRTVRRKISDLQRRLPAESRFQAGVLANRRGWL